MRVFISSVPVGDIRFLIDDEKFILYEAQPILDELEKTYNQKLINEFKFLTKNQVNEIDLDKMKEILSYQYNESELRLDILIESKYRKLQTWNSGGKEAKLSQESNFSWYLNSFLNQEFGDSSARSGDFDSALSIKSFVFEGRWNTDFDEEVESLYYRMTKDVEDIPMRLSLGDTNYSVIGQQRAFLNSGLSIESNFNLQPYNRFFPTGNTEFILENDSWITVKINERFYSRTFLRAGRHSLQELPILIGLNDITIEIEERNGRKKEINFTETGSVNVYKEGTNFFSYSIGSKNFALSNRYQEADNDFDSLFSFYHLFGYTDYLTLGTYGQIAQEEKLFALLANWRSSLVNGSFTVARGQEEAVSNGNFYELSIDQTYW